MGWGKEKKEGMGLGGLGGKKGGMGLGGLGFSGPEDEVELILSRAAVFTQPANINSIIICPLHREKLGLGWRRGSTSRCRVPMFLCSVFSEPRSNINDNNNNYVQLETKTA